MLIFPRSSAGFMIQALHRIVGLFREKCKSELGFIPTFSAGLVEYSTDLLNKMDVSAMIAEVDACLYQAKNRGKNMIVINDISVPFERSNRQQKTNNKNKR
jgi:PleD family two-component response regulator